jgi:hypothetical protein
MKKSIILIAAILAILANSYCQKIEGPVLKPEIAVKYVGDLKKGLANGNGTATGLDTYTGHFAKGLPDGLGTYTFRNGDVYVGTFKNGIIDGKGNMTLKGVSRDSILAGFWENGKFIGKEKIEPYEVSNKSGSVQEHIFASGEGNKVEISVLDPSNSYIGAQIFTEGKFVQKSYYGREYFEDVAFPISFDIKYNCTNKIKTGIISNTIRIKINKPGNWVITLKN